MSRYLPTIHTTAPETVQGQPGQWIDYQGSRGRLMARRNGSTWIAWGRSASTRFSTFAKAFHA